MITDKSSRTDTSVRLASVTEFLTVPNEILSGKKFRITLTVPSLIVSFFLCLEVEKQFEIAGKGCEEKYEKGMREKY